jgi:hypothetical protein
MWRDCEQHLHQDFSAERNEVGTQARSIKLPSDDHAETGILDHEPGRY